MTPEPVARVGDVKATTKPPGTGKFIAPAGPATGTWTAGAVTEASVPNVRAGSPEVLIGASCVFSFTGTLDSDTTKPASGTSTVTLVPKTRALRFGTTSPLVNGDKESDVFDNTLTVASQATWRTT